MSQALPRFPFYPSHASLPLEQLERMTCATSGCREAIVEKPPVLDPARMCLRCGRLERL